MASRVKEIPKGFHTATPNLTVKEGARAIDFYKRAFGAEELFRVDLEDGKVAMLNLRSATRSSCYPTRCPDAPVRPSP